MRTLLLLCLTPFLLIASEPNMVSLDEMLITSGTKTALSVEELTDATFAEKTREGFVIIDFYAVWCGPCQSFAPTFAKLAKSMEGTVKFYKLDIEKCPNALSNTQIRAIPTLVLYKDGHEIARKVGGLSEKGLKAFILGNI